MKTDKEIFDSYESGNIIYITADGMQEMAMTDFIAQTPNNILKALNRTEKILINLHENNPDSLKWINDYAVAKTIKALAEKIIEYSSSATITTTDNSQKKYDGMEAANALLQQTYNEVITLKEQLNTSNDLIDKYKKTIQDNKNEIADLNKKLNVVETNKISTDPFNIILTINPVDNSVISYRSAKTCGYVAKETDVHINDVPITNYNEQISDTTKVNTNKVNTTKVNTTKVNTNKFMSDEMPNIMI